MVQEELGSRDALPFDTVPNLGGFGSGTHKLRIDQIHGFDGLRSLTAVQRQANFKESFNTVLS